MSISTDNVGLKNRKSIIFPRWLVQIKNRHKCCEYHALTGFVRILNFERYYWACQIKKKNPESVFQYTWTKYKAVKRDRRKDLPKSLAPLVLGTVFKFLPPCVSGDAGRKVRLNSPFLMMTSETCDQIYPGAWNHIWPPGFTLSQMVGRTGLFLVALGFKVTLSSALGILCSVPCWGWVLKENIGFIYWRRLLMTMALCSARINKNSPQAQTGHRQDGMELQEEHSLSHLRYLTQHQNWKLSKTPEAGNRDPGQRLRDYASPPAGDCKKLLRSESAAWLTWLRKDID